MASYFISDIHLSPQAPDTVAALRHFLHRIAPDAEQLFILGDLFDAWIGDDEDSDFAREIIELLRRYAAGGPRCFLAHGNRDFLLGAEFSEASGFSLLPPEQRIDLYGTPTLLAHGDQWCTRDEQYMQFRAMVRSPQWQEQVLAMPLQQRRAMAAQLRQRSQSMNAMKAEDIMDVTPSEVEQAMRNHQVRRLIHGHTHRPARHQLDLDGDPAERIVLGDWHQQGWYLQASGSELNLVSFDLP